ncbi:hypothetical protein BROUX41_002537 [Berkeleyomyces rouxiae]
MLSLVRRPGAYILRPNPTALGVVPLRCTQSLTGARRGAVGRPQRLGANKVPITNDVSQWLFDSGLYRITSPKKTTQKPPPNVEKNRVHIINEKFVDEIIEYLGSSLDRHKGCDLLDINPGVGIWSKALHEALKPRKHILMEPDGDFYANHLKPLTDKPTVQMVHKHGVIWDDVYSTLKMFPEQELVPRTGPVERNDTLLVTLNLATYPKKKYQSYESVSALIMHQIITSVRTRTMFQKYGLVRMLLWTNDDEKRAYIPKNIYSRRRAAVDTEAAVDYIHEVVGSDDMSAEARANLIKLRQPTRQMCLQLESGRAVAERMKKAGRVYPKDRQSEIVQQLEDNTEEVRRKDQEYVDRIIAGLIKRREYIVEYENAHPKPQATSVPENDPSSYFLTADLVKFRNKFFMSLPDNETGEVSKKPQLYGVSKPRDAPRKLLDDEEEAALKRLAEQDALDEMDGEVLDEEREARDQEEKEEEEVKPKRRSRSKRVVEDKDEEEAKPKRRSRSRKAVDEEEEEVKPKRRSRSKKTVEEPVEADNDEVVKAKPKRGRPTRASVLEMEKERDELRRRLREDELKGMATGQEELSEGTPDRSALTVRRSATYMPAPPSPTAIVKQVFGADFNGTVRDIREWLARAYNQMWEELREKYRSGEYTMEQYMEGHKILNDEVNLAHINYIATTRLHADDSHCFHQEEPVLLWDRREYEPLITKPHDFFPDVPITLIDIQPKSMHPLLRDNVSQACVVFDVMTMTMINSLGGIEKLLDKMWPGASSGCLPNMPESVNLKRYGYPAEITGTAITAMAGRRMNMEQYYEMLEAWHKWSFRPTYAELISHHTEEPPSVADPDTNVTKERG